MENSLTRKEFLKIAGAGTAGMTLLAAAGCESSDLQFPNRRDKAPTGGSDMNIVLVILDSLRKDHIGAYGNEWMMTPNLDALAKESLLFTRPYPESLPTICARRAIHTGMRTWPFRNYVHLKDELYLWGWQPIPENQTTLAEIIWGAGYKTMLITDTFHQWQPSMNFNRGFNVYQFIRGNLTDYYQPAWMAPQEKMEKALLKGGPGLTIKFRQYFANTAHRKTEEDWFTARVFNGAAQLLEAASTRQPFFMVADSYDPHEPWDPPEEYVSLYDDPYDGPEPFQPTYGSSDYLTERQLKRMRALYAAEVTMMDRWLGRFLDKMEELNLFENTLLIVLSDHGVALGEHGYTGKLPRALYPELTDITFFIRHPGGKGAGETSEYYASTHDVAPTVLGFLGIEPPKPMEGQDLSVLLDGNEPVPRPHFTAGYHDHVWTRDENYAMFARYDGTEAKLFDLRTDPKMNTDIAGKHPGIAKRMFQEYVIKDAGGGPLPSYRKSE